MPRARRVPPRGHLQDPGRQNPLTMRESDYRRWLRRSRLAIGGSNIAAITGVSRWGDTPATVYDEKLGLRPRSGPNADMRRGQVLEAVAVDEFEQETGLRVERGRFLRHPDLWYIGGNPDRFIPGGQENWPRDGILEVKCPRELGSVVAEGPHPEYVAQLQWYMGHAGRQVGLITYFAASSWDLWISDPIEFSPEWYQSAVQAAVEFWERHILRRERPDEGAGVLSGPASLLPVIGGTAARCDDPAWVTAVARLARARQEYKIAEGAKESAEAEVKRLMEARGHDEVIGGGYHVRWKERSRRIFDEELLLGEHPEIDLSRYRRQIVYRDFRVSNERRRS